MSPQEILNRSRGNSVVTICARLSYPDELILTTTLAAAAQSAPVKHCVLIVR